MATVGDRATAPAGGPWWEASLWAVAAGALYVLLAKDAFYKTDGTDIVWLLDGYLREGRPHPWHVGYLPALGAFQRGLAAIGLVPDPLHLGAWFSASGAALGVGWLRAGTRRLGFDAGTARLATAAFACGPGVLLFATVVEFHGPVLAPIGLVFWWTCVQAARPTWVGMVALGALCHLPFLLHGSTAALPAWLLAFFVARRRPSSGLLRPVGQAALAGAVHAALLLALPRLWPGFYGFYADLAAGERTESATGRPQSLDHLPEIVLQEWLWPLLPVSVLVLLALRHRSLWLEFGAFVVGLAPFLWICVRLLVHEPEHGAYLVPLTLPAALLVAQAARGRVRVCVWLLLPLGLWPLLGDQRRHFTAQRDHDRAFAAGIAAAAGGTPSFVLIGSHRELTAAYARLPADEFLWVRPNALMPRGDVTPQHLQGTDAHLRALHAAGRVVLLTDVALRSLDDPAAARRAEMPSLTDVRPNDEVGGPLFAAQLRAGFELVPAGPGLYRLVPKP
jgi:hypothetical protein